MPREFVHSAQARGHFKWPLDVQGSSSLPTVLPAPAVYGFFRVSDMMHGSAQADEGPATAVVGTVAAGPARTGCEPAPPRRAGVGPLQQPQHQREAAPDAIDDSGYDHSPITPAAAVPGHAAVFPAAASSAAAAGVSAAPPRCATCGAAAAGSLQGAPTAIISFMQCVAGSPLVQSALLAVELSGHHPPPLLAPAAPTASSAAQQQGRGASSSRSMLPSSPQLDPVPVSAAPASLECTLAQLLALHLRAGYARGEGGAGADADGCRECLCLFALWGNVSCCSSSLTIYSASPLPPPMRQLPNWRRCGCWNQRRMLGAHLPPHAWGPISSTWPPSPHRSAPAGQESAVAASDYKCLAPCLLPRAATPARYPPRPAAACLPARLPARLPACPPALVAADCMRLPAAYICPPAEVCMRFVRLPLRLLGADGGTPDRRLGRLLLPAAQRLGGRSGEALGCPAAYKLTCICSTTACVRLRLRTPSWYASMALHFSWLLHSHAPSCLDAVYGPADEGGLAAAA